MKLRNIITVLAFPLLFIACGKDELQSDTTASKGCKLNQVFTAEGKPYAEIFYNAWGAPSHIELAEPGTGDWEYAFYYDNSKRLTALLTGILNGNDTTIWDIKKYTYENDRIVRDTMFSESDLQDGTYALSGRYAYDANNRIIQYIRQDMSLTFSDTFNYSYPIEDPFTDNHSITAGNKELMFVNRDYSKKNPHAISYNSTGYPTQFESPYRLLEMAVTVAGYSCN